MKTSVFHDITLWMPTWKNAVCTGVSSENSFAKFHQLTVLFLILQLTLYTADSSQTVDIYEVKLTVTVSVMVTAVTAVVFTCNSVQTYWQV